MIRAMLNLRCADGHRHFSPQPEAFQGRECFVALPLTKEQRARQLETGRTPRERRCQAPLRREPA